MDLIYDLDKEYLVTKAGASAKLTRADTKRGDVRAITVTFVRGSTTVVPPGEIVEMVFVAKRSTSQSSAPILLTNNWTFNATLTRWEGVITQDSARILDILSSSTTTALLSEFSFTTTTIGPLSSQIFTMSLENDLWKGDEGTPLVLPTPDEWLAARALPLPLAVTVVPHAQRIRFVSAANALDVTLLPKGLNPAGHLNYSKTGGTTPTAGQPWWALEGTPIGPNNKWNFLWVPDGGDLVTGAVSLQSVTTAVIGVLSAAWAADEDVTLVGPVPTTIGQAATVSHSDATKTEWGAVSLTEWLPRTAGILKHANASWYRQTLASDGTAEYELLPNQ